MDYASIYLKHDFLLSMDYKNLVSKHLQNCIMVIYVLNVGLIIIYVAQLCMYNMFCSFYLYMLCMLYISMFKDLISIFYVIIE